jgi:hypothetical protein
MAGDSFRDLQRRVADALGFNAKIRRETRRLLRLRGNAGGGTPPPAVSDWPRIHRHLTDALGTLHDQFEDSETGLVRSRLLREGTHACVHVRLRETQPLRVCLQAMTADAMRLPTAGPDAAAVIRLRRAVRLALGATAISAPDFAGTSTESG